MKPVYFGIAGAVLQGLCLAAFILISRTGIAAVGKPAVIGLALISVALLLWRGVQQAKTWTALCLLPVLLALGYTVAFHMLGVLGFHGLLRDWDFSIDYGLSVLHVTAIVLVLYAIATALLSLLSKVLRKRAHSH